MPTPDRSRNPLAALTRLTREVEQRRREEAALLRERRAATSRGATPDASSPAPGNPPHAAAEGARATHGSSLDPAIASAPTTGPAGLVGTGAGHPGSRPHERTPEPTLEEVAAMAQLDDAWIDRLDVPEPAMAGAVSGAGHAVEGHGVVTSIPAASVGHDRSGLHGRRDGLGLHHADASGEAQGLFPAHADLRGGRGPGGRGPAMPGQAAARPGRGTAVVDRTMHGHDAQHDRDAATGGGRGDGFAMAGHHGHAVGLAQDGVLPIVDEHGSSPQAAAAGPARRDVPAGTAQQRVVAGPTSALAGGGKPGRREARTTAGRGQGRHRDASPAPGGSAREDGSTGPLLVVEAADLPSALAEIAQRLGPQAQIVDVEQARTGGIAGFFGREVVRVHVRPPSDDVRVLSSGEVAARTAAATRPTGDAGTAPGRRVGMPDGRPRAASGGGGLTAALAAMADEAAAMDGFDGVDREPVVGNVDALTFRSLLDDAITSQGPRVEALPAEDPTADALPIALRATPEVPLVPTVDVEVLRSPDQPSAVPAPERGHDGADDAFRPGSHGAHGGLPGRGHDEAGVAFHARGRGAAAGSPAGGHDEAFLPAERGGARTDRDTGAGRDLAPASWSPAGAVHSAGAAAATMTTGDRVAPAARNVAGADRLAVEALADAVMDRFEQEPDEAAEDGLAVAAQADAVVDRLAQELDEAAADAWSSEDADVDRRGKAEHPSAASVDAVVAEAEAVVDRLAREVEAATSPASTATPAADGRRWRLEDLRQLELPAALQARLDERLASVDPADDLGVLVAFADALRPWTGAPTEGPHLVVGPGAAAVGEALDLPTASLSGRLHRPVSACLPCGDDRVALGDVAAAREGRALMLAVDGAGHEGLLRLRPTAVCSVGPEGLLAALALVVEQGLAWGHHVPAPGATARPATAVDLAISLRDLVAEDVPC